MAAPKLKTEEELKEIAEALKLKLGVEALHHIQVGDDYEVLVTSPTPEEYDRFEVLGVDDRKRKDALKVLARLCIKWPSGPDFAEMVKAQPGIYAPIGERLIELAGALRIATSKKM